MKELIKGSRVVFGLGKLHHLPSRRAREELIRQAIECGIKHFDVAPAYGNGLAERALGAVATEMGTSIRVNTKYGIPVTEYGAMTDAWFPLRRAWDMLKGSHKSAYATRRFEPDVLTASLMRSLHRLRRRDVSVLFLHEPREALNQTEWVAVSDSMKRLILAGYTEAWGVSGSTESYRWDEHLPQDGVAQMPATELRDNPNRGEGRRLIVYGLHADYIRQGEKGSFSQFLGAWGRAVPNASFIVATNRIERLRSWVER